MSAKYWIKLYHEILNDPKMIRLDDRLWRRAIELFLLAGQENRDGELPSLEDMGVVLRCDTEQLETEMIELQHVGILDRIDRLWFVAKFAKRQEALPKAEYMRRQRSESQKREHYQSTYRETLPSSDHPVTRSHADTDKDTDKDKRLADGKARPQRKSDILKAQLEKHFSEVTGNPIPKRDTERQRKEAAVRWWNPLAEILSWFEGELSPAEELISDTVAYMRSQSLTIASPASILEVARAQFGQQKQTEKGNYVHPSWK